jgi:hypothetical protein
MRTMRFPQRVVQAMRHSAAAGTKEYVLDADGFVDIELNCRELCRTGIKSREGHAGSFAASSPAPMRPGQAAGHDTGGRRQPRGQAEGRPRTPDAMARGQEDLSLSGDRA